MKYYLTALLVVLSVCVANAQKQEGNLANNDVMWNFDGYNLTLTNVNKNGLPQAIDDYDVNKNLAPWVKKGLKVRRVNIDNGITRIGSCAFANMPELQEVVFFGNDVSEIGWGAFLNCENLRTISLPVRLSNIETIAFAKCNSLSAISLPDHCRVADKAFFDCKNIKNIQLSPTTMLGHMVFGNEEKVNGKLQTNYYAGELRNVPPYINSNNCTEYGFAPSALENSSSRQNASIDYDYATSDVDTNIAIASYSNYDTYALIIGNQNYRFVSDVPYAIHDARIFAEYCKKTLGIPVENIHLSEDATKQMILEEELEDWVRSIPNKRDKKLIVYYAGHGVPDQKNKNKAYILPTDVRGTNPHRGIALEDFYKELGNMNFAQTSVFLDACFSGINRDNEGVTEGLRGVEIAAEEAELGNGALVVFSAAQGNETAQGYPEEGHGLFTYYLLQAIRESNGLMNFGRLSEYLSGNVSKTAKNLQMRKPQNPSTNASEQIADNWHLLRL